MQRTVAGPYRLLMPHVDNAEDGCWSIQIAHAACDGFLLISWNPRFWEPSFLYAWISYCSQTRFYPVEPLSWFMEFRFCTCALSNQRLSNHLIPSNLFAGTNFTRSVHSDELYMDEGNVRTQTNRSGGVHYTSPLLPYYYSVHFQYS